MNGRKWTILFLSALALTFALWGGINVLADPFGVFGISPLSWDSYSQTLNPRIGKAEYLSRHLDDYDSYIVGSSSAASYLPQTLEQYEDGTYYNMFHYGADIAYDETLVRWLLENDDVRHIVLVLGLNEANMPVPTEGLTGKSPRQVTGESPLSYYLDFLFADLGYAREKIASRQSDTVMPQAFDVFLPADGTYDKRLRDAEPIGTRSDYLAENGGGFAPTQAQTLTNIEGCADTVGRIKALCEAAGTRLTVILSPVSDSQLAGYSDDTLNAYFKALAEITDYHNYSITSLSFDERYFYDATHTRNAAANMVLASLYGDPDAYYPREFGAISENGSYVTAQALRAKASAAVEEDYTAHIPILLYHHLDPDGEENGTTLHPDTFEGHMALLRDNGYTSITLDALVSYVEGGTPLPEKPVLVTFDDGYLSNYEYGLPILREHGMTATVFAIGSSVGHYEFYKGTDHPLTPHFGKSELEEMAGIIDVQSHTYDMHQWAPFEDGGAVRETVLPLEGESEADYIAALCADMERQNTLFAELGLPTPTSLAFPRGEFTRLSNVTLLENGYKVTLTTDHTRVNCIVKGLPQSLLNLGRLNISAETTDDEILAYCER